MHIVEAWGTGIPRILSRCSEYGLPEPIFEEFGNNFKVTMLKKIGNEPLEVGNALKKVSNDLLKVSNAPKKVSNDPLKEGNAFEKYIPLLKDAEISEKFIASIYQVFAENESVLPFGQANRMVRMLKIQSNECYECYESCRNHRESHRTWSRQVYVYRVVRVSVTLSSGPYNHERHASRDCSGSRARSDSLVQAQTISSLRFGPHKTDVHWTSCALTLPSRK